MAAGGETCGFPGPGIIRVFVLRSWPTWRRVEFVMHVKRPEHGMFILNPLFGKYQKVPISEFQSVVRLDWNRFLNGNTNLTNF